MPKKPASSGKTAAFSTRISPELRARLDAAAHQNGRNLTEEIEGRLQASFRLEDEREQAIAGFGTRQNFAVCRLVADLMVHISAAAGRSWVDDPWTADQVARGVQHLLRELRPAGDSPPPELRRYPAGQVDQLGEMTAAGQLLMLDVTDSNAPEGSAKPGEPGYRFEAIKADLGDLVNRGGSTS